jgi:RNA polymerase sigma-70 factor (ECF subfamily)
MLIGDIDAYREHAKGVHRHGEEVVTISQQEDLVPSKERVADCIAQHLPFVNRMVRSLMRNDPMTEDIVQQTMLKALVHADRFRCESTLKTWLGSIAINEVRQLYRCKWRTRAVPMITENLKDDRSLKAESPSPSYQAREREALIRRAVSRLPEPYRCVVELCDLQSLSLNEAADRLHLNMPAVKSRRQRARRKLLPFVVKLKT